LYEVMAPADFSWWPSVRGLPARLSSGIFADQPHGLLWMVALLFNMLCFGIVALPVWLISRKRWPTPGTLLILGWMSLYVAMLFLLFPAMDGP
jgi:hypothetical protein